VRSINNLACAYAEMKRTGEAEAAFQKGLKLAEERLGPEHRDTGGILYSYSTLLRSTGRKAEARKMELRWKLIQEDTARVNGLGLTLDARNVRRP
jgi:hypothetical protein